MTMTIEPTLDGTNQIKAIFGDKPIRKVLFINPPDGEAALFRMATVQRKRYTNYPPYGLGVLAQHIRGLGIETTILNLNNHVLKTALETPKDALFAFDKTWQQCLEEEISAFTPDLICVTCMFTMTHHSMKKVVQSAAASGIPVAIGGVHISNDAARILDDIPEAQFAFLREADIAMKNFILFVNGQKEAVELGQLVINLPGQRYWLERELQPTAAEMDVIPAYDLMDIAHLSERGVIGNFHGFKPKGTRFATCLSNRGCRARCTFCSVRNFNGEGVRQRSVESVLDELEMLRYTYGVGHVVWLDDDLLRDHRRALALFNGMINRKLELTWDATNGVIAASCTDEIVQAMAESGCIALNIGMESGNKDILRQVRKPGTVKTFLAAAEVLKRYPQIHARVFLMIGFPNETLRMIRDTIDVVREMDLDWAGITPLQPLPNTPIYDAMVEQGLIQPVGSSEVRFMAGAYGKQDEIDLGLRMVSQDFAAAFGSIPLDEMPNQEQIQDIWFYMNYHLNFHRLFTETRPLKLRQQLQNLTALSDVISPEHGFALYFAGYLHYRLSGAIPPELIRRLDEKLTASDYWRARFEAFGLFIDDLKTANFKDKDMPCLLPMAG